MSVFRPQEMRCSVCGISFLYDFKRKHVTCSSECFEEAEWRYTLFIMGKEYYPKRDTSMEQGDDGRPD